MIGVFKLLMHPYVYMYVCNVWNVCMHVCMCVCVCVHFYRYMYARDYAEVYVIANEDCLQCEG